MSFHHREETSLLSSAIRDGNAAGHAPFASEVTEDINKLRIPLALEMTGCWVGSMPVNDFHDECLPVPSDSEQGGSLKCRGPFPPLSSRPLVDRCTRTLPVFSVPDQGPQCDDITNHAEPGFPHISEEASPWERKGVVYLKDTWCFLSNDLSTRIMCEHKFLHETKTPNIPKHVAGGDVPGGMTQTQDFLDANSLCVNANAKVTPFRHYRLMLCAVGRPLTKFQCTKQLVQAVYADMQAHWSMYEITSILHQDISVANIRITNDGHGLLIDWETRKLVGEVGAPRYDRAGTWQFMSAALLRPGDAHKMHTLSDDIESFIHVIGWLIIRLVPSTGRFHPAHRVAKMKMLDDVDYRVEDRTYGGLVKEMALCAGHYLGRDFKFKQSTPLSLLFSTLREPFKAWYSTAPMDEDRLELAELASTLEDEDRLLELRVTIRAYDRGLERLKSSTWFIDTIGAALANAGWPEDDAADETVYISSTELEELTSHNQFANSKGSSGGSKRRAASPAPEPAAKRRRGD